VAAAAKHLGWPQVKVQAAVHYAEVYPQEINEAIADNQATDVATLRNLLPQTVEFVPKKPVRG
jgi:uncharacterized membrane protein